MKVLPTLKQLEYLVALADAEHFGKAADACNVTPSTLSAGIKELETLLGAPLAERTKRTVMMTPLGVQIAGQARAILRDAEELMALAAATRAPLSGDLRLGVIPTIGPYLLPRVLPGLRETYPDLRLFLREERTDALLEKLRRGDLDAAVIALPYDTDGLTVRPLFEDPFRLACPAAHDLARLGPVHTDDLGLAPLLLLEEGHCLRGHALDACHLDTLRHRGEFEATSLQTLVQMVDAGLGVTLLPELAVDAGITAGSNIKLVEIDGAPSRQIGLVWRRASYRADEFELLARELAAVRSAP